MLLLQFIVVHINSIIAVSYPLRYLNSSSNDASYWPLDYPPLSGYQVREGLRSCPPRRSLGVIHCMYPKAIKPL